MRARKLRQTRDAIHRAAVTLALELGPDAATVAAISEKADISPRTFFNYFPRKEDAIMGLHEGLPSDEELDDFRAGTSDELIDEVVRLLLTLFSPEDDHLLAQRRALALEYPTLIQRQWVRVQGIEQRIAGTLADRMRAAESFAHLGDIDLAALVLVASCSSLLRLSIRKTVEQGTYPAELATHVDECIRILREMLSNHR